MEDVIQSSSATESVSKKGKFFGMSMQTVNYIVQAGYGVNEVMAYLVLCRGVSARGGHKRLSTHGVNSIAQRTGLTHAAAKQALCNVEALGIAVKEPQKDDAASTKQSTKWLVKDESLDLHLANALTDGVGRGVSNRPLQRIYQESNLGEAESFSQARLDTLMVLLNLYMNQDIQAYGGVNPRSGIFREWNGASGSNSFLCDIAGTPGAFFQVEGGFTSVVTAFANNTLAYIPDPEIRLHRFWSAFYCLRSLGFVYEVLMVWSRSPFEKDGDQAEPLYTLYIHDRHARESEEPSLFRQVNDLACKTILDRGEFFSEDSEVLNSGKFLFVANKKTGGYPIGIYRLKFRPHTRDVGIGMETEVRRVQYWKSLLQGLNK